ncbi:hypothetical protein [Novosphingobium sp. THN1]|uniref:hypothetical protein n=1 Tax=Novosphingobium sp. THN1 TaxID=1016987 RepID=UPI001F083589|nr:hypothetical protein [Novosphingobium sp. THN1]
MAEAAEAYVADAFGQHLALAPIAPAALPHFILDRYAMWQGALNGRKLLLMAVQEVLPTGSGVTVQYLKHREMVQQQLGADLVLLLLDRASGTFRRQMIERKIGFIAPGAQIYVPKRSSTCANAHRHSLLLTPIRSARRRKFCCSRFSKAAALKIAALPSLPMNCGYRS